MLIWRKGTKFINILNLDALDKRLVKDIDNMSQDEKNQLFGRSKNKPVSKVKPIKKIHLSSSEKEKIYYNKIDSSSTQFRGKIEKRGSVLRRESKMKLEKPENADFSLLSEYDEIDLDKCIKLDEEKLIEIQKKYDEEKKNSKFGVPEKDIVKIDLNEDWDEIDNSDLDYGESRISIFDTAVSQEFLENYFEKQEKSNEPKEKENVLEVVERAKNKLGIPDEKYEEKEPSTSKLLEVNEDLLVGHGTECLKTIEGQLEDQRTELRSKDIAGEEIKKASEKSDAIKEAEKILKEDFEKRKSEE